MKKANNLKALVISLALTASVLSLDAKASDNLDCGLVAVTVKTLAEFNMENESKSNQKDMLEYLDDKLGRRLFKVVLYMYKTSSDEALLLASHDDIKEACDALVGNEYNES